VQAEIVVIGGGVAGLTAAAVVANHGHNVLVIEQLAPGGQIATIDNIQNVPGFADGIAGYDLGPLLHKQAEDHGAYFLFDEVTQINQAPPGFTVQCATNTVTARAVIVAAGSHRRALGLANEEAFTGRGVSHCASCDGPLFKGQAVIVAGGGDSAFDEAETLAGCAASVTIVHRGGAPRAQKRTVERVAALANVSILANSEVEAIVGADGVESVIVCTPRGETTLPCGGIFVNVGLAPNTLFLRDFVNLDETGAIVTDSTLQSSRVGVFAAGDIRSGAVALLPCIAGDGASAAMSAIRFIRS
jgi:thioredoxin reductase (NADPH)